MSTFGYLLNTTNPANAIIRESVDNAARSLGINLEVIEVKDQSGLAGEFTRMKSVGVGGLVVQPDPVFASNLETIVELGRVHKLPTAFDGNRFVPLGGLLAFPNDYVYLGRRSTSYVDQILKGAAPGDLAMEEGKVYKLLVNLKTAKELGITISADHQSQDRPKRATSPSRRRCSPAPTS